MTRVTMGRTIRGLALFALMVALVGAALGAPGRAEAASCRAASAGCARVDINVVDAATGKYIGYAKVSVMDAGRDATDIYSVNDVGAYSGWVMSGSYTVLVTAIGYNSYNGTISVQSGASNGLKVALTPNVKASKAGAYQLNN